MRVANGVIYFDGAQVSFVTVGVGLVIFVLIGVIGGEVARRRGHPAALWLILCSLFPPLLLAVLNLSNKRLQRQAAAAAAQSPAKKKRKEA